MEKVSKVKSLREIIEQLNPEPQPTRQRRPTMAYEEPARRDEKRTPVQFPVFIFEALRDLRLLPT
jgi:hypothetical protein